MARPAQPEKRRALARRAVGVLQVLGLEVSMSRVAAELGVKRPTLLYHLPTRADIARVALEDLLTRQAAYVMAEVNRHDHPIDRLDAQVRAVHAFHDGREGRLVFLAQAIATSTADQMAAIIAVGNRVFEAHRTDAANRIRAGIDAGIVHPCDADALVSLVRSVIDGLVVQRVMVGVDLGPSHQFLWQHVLAPLKKDCDAATFHLTESP